ncbi:MAG: HEAT repeat domain-containing protein, partial [Armatimonadota bacterium]|nr:HEAT repeat domain-containing protein [Armatimonadota bacterium]
APRDYRPGGASQRLVGFVDLAPTLLSLAGVRPPAWMQGRAFAGPYQTSPPAVMHGLRGRMDARYDLVRTVTDGRYVYVRNFLPHLPHGQRVHYQFRNDTTRAWHRLYTEGKTNAAQSHFWKAPRAPEELYDLANDPDEVHNLASHPEHGAVLARLREEMRRQAARVRDVGFLPEAEVNRRSGTASPYDMARTPGRYHFERVFEAAERASSLDASVLPQLRAGLTDRDSGVRYWSVLGLRMRGAAAVASSGETLRRLLDDESPSVRVAAAEALAAFGEGAVLYAAGKTLAALLQEEGDDVPTVLAVLNAVEQTAARLARVPEVARAVAQIPANNPRWEARSSGNIATLKPDVVKALEIP